MTRRALFATAAMLASIGLAFAHDSKKGANGGPEVHAGSFHVEALADGTTLQVWLRDGGDKPVSSVGFAGTAIFVISGKPRRIPLAPAGENKLTGTSEVPIPAALKGAVRITTPSGNTLQAKFD